MANVTDLFSFYQCSQLVDRNRRRFFIDDKRDLKRYAPYIKVAFIPVKGSHRFHIKNTTLYKKSLAQEEGYGACFSREGSAEVKSENRS